MTDNEPHPQLRAVEVRISCMLHGMQYMQGSPMVYNLGHGRTYQTTGNASCQSCGDDKWLQILLFEEEVLEVENKDYAAALMVALESEIGKPEPEDEEVADEDPHEEDAGEVVQSTGEGGGLPFRRRPLQLPGAERPGSPGEADGAFTEGLRESA